MTPLRPVLPLHDMARIRLDGPFEFRLPAHVVRRLEMELILRVLAGWDLLLLLATLFR